MRILKSNVIGNLRDRVIRVRQLSHCAVRFGFQDELLQCHSGASWKREERYLSL